MDIKKIEKLIALIEKSSVNEIEIKEGDTAIRITGGQNQQAASAVKTGHIEIPVPQQVSQEKQNTEVAQAPKIPEGKYIIHIFYFTDSFFSRFLMLFFVYIPYFIFFYL